FRIFPIWDLTMKIVLKQKPMLRRNFMFFLGDIALMLELFGVCLALVYINKAREAGGLVRAAGIILLIGSLLLGFCTMMAVSKRRGFIENEMKSMKDKMMNKGE